VVAGSLPVRDPLQRRAAPGLKEQAVAAYDRRRRQDYRETVLTAFRPGRDNLAALRILAEEARYQNDAVSEAELALKLAKQPVRQRGHLIPGSGDGPIDGADQREAGRRAADRRLTAGIAPDRGLGGGWHVSDPGRVTRGLSQIIDKVPPAEDGRRILTLHHILSTWGWRRVCRKRSP